MKTVVTIILICVTFVNLKAQDSSIQNKFTMNGYLKGLASYQIDKSSKTGLADQLMHNRLNLKWKLNSQFQFTSEIRNRLFFGEQIKNDLKFSEKLRNTNEYFNLQKSWTNNEQFVLHTNIERLFTDIKNGKWILRVGRQRINWGIGTTWNPNDMFNSYNFLDVDYEERPGSDAVKLTYNTTTNSNFEFVHSQVKNQNSITAAKFGFNIWNYDFQFIAGDFKGNATLGVGWAGNIRDAGFKGEIQYYFNSENEQRQLNLVVDLDYMFNNGWYASFGGLYNSNGLNKALDNLYELNLNLSAKNLMPTRYNYILRIKKELSPIAAIGGNMIYAPRVNMIILMPSFNYNISNSLDVDVFIQSFYLKSESRIKSMTDYGIIRLRFSF